MTATLLYIARASLYLAIFYAFYLLVMRRTSLFRFNRIALLVGTVACHVLPLLRLRTVTVPDFSAIQVDRYFNVSFFGCSDDFAPAFTHDKNTSSSLITSAFSSSVPHVILR